MKSLIMSIIFMLCIGIFADAQQLSLNADRDIGIMFCSDSQWSEVPGSVEGRLELENRNHNLHVTFWREESSKAPIGLLENLIKREGLACENDPFELLIDGRKAHAVFGNCNQMRKPVKVLLIAVQNKEGYCMIKFKCPSECFTEHRKIMSELIGAIHLVDTFEPILRIAAYSKSS